MNHSDGSIEPREHDGVERAWDDRLRFGDERASDVTEPNRGGTTAGSVAAYGWISLLIIAAGAVNILSAAKDTGLSGGTSGLPRPFLLELTSAAAWIAFLPLLRYGTAQLRLNQNRAAAFAIALGAALLYALLHLVTMVMLRNLLFGLVADSYSFHWAAEFPYEIRKDIISTLMIALLFWLMQRKATTAPLTSVGEPVATSGEPASIPLKPGLWLRDGATSFHIDPRDIVSVTSAGNYVEFNLPTGRRLIRGTLAAEEVRLKPFGLVRIHRARLVNLNRVVAVELYAAGDFLLRMDNGEAIGGSRRYRKAATSIKDAASSSDQ